MTISSPVHQLCDLCDEDSEWHLRVERRKGQNCGNNMSSSSQWNVSPYVNSCKVSKAALVFTFSMLSLEFSSYDPDSQECLCLILMSLNILVTTLPVHILCQFPLWAPPTGHSRSSERCHSFLHFASGGNLASFRPLRFRSFDERFLLIRKFPRAESNRRLSWSWDSLDINKLCSASWEVICNLVIANESQWIITQITKNRETN